jgi:hypothetical protein
VTLNCPDSSASFGQNPIAFPVFLGDITITGFVSAGLSGWKVNNGAGGGNITITGGGQIITISQPDPTQISTFHNITLSALMDSGPPNSIDLSEMGNIAITGTMSVDLADSATLLLTPSGNWLTLGPAPGSTNGASAFGVTVGHVPALANILPNDNLFGQAGTLVVATLATIEAAVPTVAQIAASILASPGTPLANDASGNVGIRLDHITQAAVATTLTNVTIPAVSEVGETYGLNAYALNQIWSDNLQGAGLAASGYLVNAATQASVNALPTAAQIATAIGAPSAATIAAAVAVPSAAAIADAVKAINVDSTGGQAISAGKCLEVLLSRAIGNATYDPAAAVNTLMGRDGATPIASVKLTGSGNRQQSTIN